MIILNPAPAATTAQRGSTAASGSGTQANPGIDFADVLKALAGRPMTVKDAATTTHAKPSLGLASDGAIFQLVAAVLNGTEASATRVRAGRKAAVEAPAAEEHPEQVELAADPTFVPDGRIDVAVVAAWIDAAELAPAAAGDDTVDEAVDGTTPAIVAGVPAKAADRTAIKPPTPVVNAEVPAVATAATVAAVDQVQDDEAAFEIEASPDAVEPDQVKVKIGSADRKAQIAGDEVERPHARGPKTPPANAPSLQPSDAPAVNVTAVVNDRVATPAPIEDHAPRRPESSVRAARSIETPKVSQEIALFDAAAGVMPTRQSSAHANTDSPAKDGRASSEQSAAPAPREVPAPQETPVFHVPATSVVQSRHVDAPVEPARAEFLSAADAARLPEQIVQTMKLQWQGGMGEAHIRLRPEYLGELTVSLTVHEGSVTAALQSNTPAVRQWIEGNEPMLRQALAAQGLDLGRLIVTEETQPGEREQGHARQQSSHHQRPEEESRRHHGRRRASDEATFEVVV